MLYAEPGPALSDILFGDRALPFAEQKGMDGVIHRLRALYEPPLINIVSTELAQRRLIRTAPSALTSDETCKETSRKTILAALYNEECPSDFRILPLHRYLSAHPPALTGFLDGARLLFHIEHIPTTASLALDPARIAYLLSHGTELGGAFIAFIAGRPYLLRARLDVIATMAASRPDGTLDARAVADRIDDAHGVLTSSISAPPDIVALEYLLSRTLNLALDDRAVSVTDDVNHLLHRVRDGSPLAFCLNPPSLLQVQQAALLSHPLAANTFTIAPQVPADLLSGLFA